MGFTGFYWVNWLAVYGCFNVWSDGHWWRYCRALEQVTAHWIAPIERRPERVAFFSSFHFCFEPFPPFLSCFWFLSFLLLFISFFLIYPSRFYTDAINARTFRLGVHHRLFLAILGLILHRLTPPRMPNLHQAKLFHMKEDPVKIL